MKNRADQPMPIARQDGLLVRELNNEVLVYDLFRDRAHCLNTAAAMVWRSCDGKSRISEISQAMQSSADGSLNEEAVWLAIEQLQRAHLIEASSAPETVFRRLSRRDLIKKAGIAAAVALPFVTSITAPKAVEAATCLAPNAPCTANGQCCNGTCIGAPSGVCN
jgi:hypothetical protein